ncbi:MAG: restriction endonuclease subunit S, partial [Euryarchaeota archaeon]|nr:restriction endonuclease subunit S [Euryarchaeota archaeon]
DIIIPLPPLPEQHRIAEVLSAADKKLELAHNRPYRPKSLYPVLKVQGLIAFFAYKAFSPSEQFCSSVWKCISQQLPIPVRPNHDSIP